jgi:hypothetical protein
MLPKPLRKGQYYPQPFIVSWTKVMNKSRYSKIEYRREKIMGEKLWIGKNIYKYYSMKIFSKIFLFIFFPAGGFLEKKRGKGE